jgi:hypothetical protein
MILFLIFQIEEMNNFLQKLDPRYLLGPEWDMYLMTFFALLIGFIILLLILQMNKKKIIITIFIEINKNF